MTSSPVSLHPSDPVAALSTSWFGMGLSPEAISRLAAIATLRDVDPGIELTREGQVTEDLGIVITGRIALRTLVPERGMVTILTVEPGDVVGWSAIVPPHRASSTAIAIEPVQVLVLPGDGLRNLLRSDPSLAASVYPRVLQTVARRLSATRLQLLDLFAREAWGRGESQPW
jgi:CRP/FNR family transcriptional regulator, cyclic AMP receptor protein